MEPVLFFELRLKAAFAYCQSSGGIFQLDEGEYRAVLEGTEEGKALIGEMRSYMGQRYTFQDFMGHLNHSTAGLRPRDSKTGTARWKDVKRGIYRFKDLYFAFWFRFVAPYFEEIESGFLDGALEEFKRGFNHYFGFVFEEVAKGFLIELNRAGKLSFKFTKIGRWWRKGEEIDLVALNEREKRALFVEVKWKSLGEREARGILRGLERKGELIGLDEWEKSYGLVAKSMKREKCLKAEGWLLWDLGDFDTETFK